MGRISERDVAERAGVDRNYVSHLVGVGVLAPAADGTFSDGDARRARLCQGLEGAGLPMEALVSALDRDELSLDFLDLPVYDRFSVLTPMTFRELSEQEKIPLALLLVVREAMGFAHAEPDQQVREDELEIVPLIEMQLSRGTHPAAIERWLRVYGESLRRIVETEADWWRTQFALPHLSSGMNAAEMLRVTGEWGGEFASRTERTLMAIYRANQEHTWNETLIEEIEDALDHAGVRTRMNIAPAICFLDITGYTQLTEERGDEAAAELADRLAPLVQRPADHYGGKVVKWLGDGVMFHFRDSTSGVEAALDMVDAISAAGLPPAHVGVHSGPVVFQGGDYFGRTVNVAARISAKAGPGQVLVSQEVVDRVASDGFAIEPIGAVELKGVAHAVQLHAVTR